MAGDHRTVPESVINDLIIQMRTANSASGNILKEWNKVTRAAASSTFHLPSGMTVRSWPESPRKAHSADLALGSGWHNPMCEPLTVVSAFDSPESFLTVVWPITGEPYAVVYGAKDLHTIDPPHI